MAKDDKKEMSPAQAAFAALIETYAKQNPAKYVLKKDVLQKKLEALA